MGYRIYVDSVAKEERNCGDVGRDDPVAGKVSAHTNGAEQAAERSSVVSLYEIAVARLGELISSCDKRTKKYREPSVAKNINTADIATERSRRIRRSHRASG